MRYLMLAVPLVLLTGCRLPAGEAQPEPGEARGQEDSQPIAVQTAQAETGPLTALTYTGTTRPVQQVALRAQISGTVLDLTADVGDAVGPGQVLARLDRDAQTASVNQAQAELSARRAEAAQTGVAIADAQAAVVQAQAQLDQAQTDAARLRRLADQGAISQQAAEAAALAQVNAQQALQSAQAQVAAQQQVAAAATDRIDAQRAVVDQSQAQLSDTVLVAPLAGVVLARPVDAGDGVDAGATVLELGDLTTLTVTVQVSELDLAQLTLGQPAQVQLDAFPRLGKLSGRITQISPLADATSRLVPVEVTLPNPNGQVGSGLLARVQFTPSDQSQVSIPASALTVGAAGTAENAVFVVTGTDTPAAVARPVTVGERSPDRVEIIAGLSPGEAVVVQSDRPLADGQAVRLSILSE